MIEVLTFVFRDFWTFLGTLMLVSTVAHGLGGAIHFRLR